MWKIFKKDPLTRMERRYLNLLEKATKLQRKGDQKGYAHKMAALEALQKRIEEEKEKQKQQ